MQKTSLRVGIISTVHIGTLSSSYIVLFFGFIQVTPAAVSLLLFVLSLRIDERTATPQLEFHGLPLSTSANSIGGGLFPSVEEILSAGRHSAVSHETSADESEIRLRHPASRPSQLTYSSKSNWDPRRRL